MQRGAGAEVSYSMTLLPLRSPDCLVQFSINGSQGIVGVVRVLDLASRCLLKQRHRSVCALSVLGGKQREALWGDTNCDSSFSSLNPMELMTELEKMASCSNTFLLKTLMHHTGTAKIFNFSVCLDALKSWMISSCIFAVTPCGCALSTRRQSPPTPFLCLSPNVYALPISALKIFGSLELPLRAITLRGLASGTSLTHASRISMCVLDESDVMMQNSVVPRQLPRTVYLHSFLEQLPGAKWAGVELSRAFLTSSESEPTFVELSRPRGDSEPSFLELSRPGNDFQPSFLESVVDLEETSRRIFSNCLDLEVTSSRVFSSFLVLEVTSRRVFLSCLDLQGTSN